VALVAVAVAIITIRGLVVPEVLATLLLQPHRKVITVVAGMGMIPTSEVPVVVAVAREL
jgi:short-subunit dehydrogenase involved in D-alanine esterification of teichoic acids